LARVRFGLVGYWVKRAHRETGLEPGISLQKYSANTRELRSLFSWPPERAPCYIFFIETDPTRHIVLCLVYAARVSVVGLMRLGFWNSPRFDKAQLGSEQNFVCVGCRAGSRSFLNFDLTPNALVGDYR
jgi:hypothetical protein